MFKFKFLSVFLALFLIGAVVSLLGGKIDLVPEKNKILSGVSALQNCEKYSYQAINFDKSERRNCFAGVLAELVIKRGPKIAMESFEAYRKTDEGTKITEPRCHSLGHDIGNAAALADYPPREILEGCRDYCIGGCINGAAHVYVLEGKSVPELEAFCGTTGIDPSISRTCYHGIGHAFVEYTNIDVAKTMQICTQIKDREGRYQCGHAAVMDYGIPASAPLSSLPQDISGFCSKQDEAFRDSCYIFTGFLEYARSLNVLSATKECNEVPSDFIESCKYRLGEVLFSKFEFDDPGKAVKECLKADFKDALECVKGVAIISIHSTSGALGDFGRKICGSASEPIRSTCYQVMAKEIEEKIGASEKNEFCLKLEPFYRQQCLETQ